jgi:glycosyltransferase involved in cell wall biosynthesis
MLDPVRTEPGGAAAHMESSSVREATPGQIPVLLFIGALGAGGAERQLIHLANGLDRKRWKPTIIVARSSANSLQHLLAPDVPVIRLLHGQDDSLDRSRPRRVMLMAWYLWRTLRSVRTPAVLHAYMPMGYGMASLVNRLGCGAVMVAGRRSLWTNRSYGPIEKFLGHVANRFIAIHVCNSQAVSDHAIAAERLDPRLMRVVHNGVFVPEGRTVGQDRKSSERPVRAAVVANFYAYKGHHYLFRALNEANLGAALTVDLYGYEQSSAELREEVAELGLEDVVRFRGAPTDAGALLDVYDFTILPSLTEGLPNAVLESMAHSVPVVASRVGGIPEIITDDIDGLLVPPADATALASAIGRMATDSALRKRLGLRARQTVHERFSMESMVRGNEAIYMEVLGSAAEDLSKARSS